MSRPLTLGVGARLRSGTVLYDGATIGERFETGHHVVIREDCTVGSDVSVWTGSVVDYGCRIEDDVEDPPQLLRGAVHRDPAGGLPRSGGDAGERPLPRAAGVGTDDVGPGHRGQGELGVGVTVLPYVRIGEGCLVGSGSVVTRDLPAGTVAFGNPAVVRRRVDDLPPLDTRIVTASDPDASYQLVAPHRR